MLILGIETSCDETSVALIEGHENELRLLTNVVASSLAMHVPTGGIIPENAAREQVKYMLPVMQEALKQAEKTLEDIDGIAVTYGPGLIGSLLVGVETAKTLAYVLGKPIIPVNHMVGHIYANFIIQVDSPIPSPQSLFPSIVLVVSGGHTDLLLMKAHGDFTLLGGTRDDAAGEAYDKIGRMLSIAYPAGPEIDRRAQTGDPKRFRFPRPLLHEDTYEFSFSGLKTAVLREILKLGADPIKPTEKPLPNQTINDICRGAQDAIREVLVKKTIRAAKEHNAKAILLSGGVAANQTLRDEFMTRAKELELPLIVPPRSLCTDNAAMIASAAYFNFKPVPWEVITADPELYF